jgi:hypothetical protein
MGYARDFSAGGKVRLYKIGQATKCSLRADKITHLQSFAPEVDSIKKMDNEDKAGWPIEDGMLIALCRYWSIILAAISSNDST